MIRRPPRSTQSRSSAASDVYKRQYVSDSYVSTSRLNDLPTRYCNVHAMLYDRSNYYTSRMKEEYIGVLGSGDCNHITFPFTVYNESHFGAQVYVHDPDSNEYSDTSRAVSYTHLTLPTIYSV